MIITKKQLEEIRRGLAVLGVRDTDLPDATTLTGAELVAIIQGKENRKVAIGDLFGKYLEGMLPYAVRGLSAYQVAQENGFDGSVELWLESLKASVEIDNNFEGGCYKVASAEEAKWLKESLEALQRIALTKNDVVNTLTSDSTDKPLSAAMGKELKRLIANGQSGSTVSVIDNLNSTSTSAALSANQGRVLKELIERMIELSNGIQNIYKWSEFQTIQVHPTDTRESLVNVRVAYELYAMLKDLRRRIADLEDNSGSGGSGGGGSDGGGGDSDVVTASLILTPTSATINATGTTQLTARYKTYKNGVEQTDLNVTSGVTWSSSSAYATVSGGLVTGNNTSTTQERTATITARYNNKEAYSTITIRKSGDDVIDTRPRIIISPTDSIQANGDGKFIVAGVPSETTGLTVTTQNTSSDWEINQSTVPDWLEVTKGTGAVNFDIIKSAKKDAQTANVELRLVNDHDTTATVNVFFDASEDSPVPGDSEIIFRDMDGASSHTFSKLGGKVVLVVIAPSAWTFSSIPSWVTLYEHETTNEISESSYAGTEGETLFDLIVESSDTLHDTSYINCVLVGQLDIRGGSYAVKQDPSIAGEINILDTDGLNHIAVSSSGNPSKAFVVYSTGTFTVNVKESDRSWLSAVGGGYTWTGEETDHEGVRKYVSISANPSEVSGRIGVLEAKLDNTGLSRKLFVCQYGNSSHYFALFSNDVPLSGGSVTLMVDAPGNPTWWVYAEHVDSRIFEFPAWSQDEINGQAIYKGHGDSISGIIVHATTAPREVTVPVHIAVAGMDSNTAYATLFQNDSQDAAQPDEQLLASTEDNVQLVSASTTSVQINVISNIEWEAEVTDGTGIAISPASGTSPGGAIICTIGPNTGDSLREFEVTVSPKTVTAKSPNPVVVGFAQDTPTPTEVWSVSPDSVELTNTVNSYVTLSVASSGRWDATWEEDFYTLSSTGDDGSGTTSVVVLSANSGESPREGTITFESAGKESIEVSVSQPPVGGGGEPDPTDEWSVSDETVELTNTVNSYVTLTLFSSESWEASWSELFFNVSPYSNVGSSSGQSITILVNSANNGAEPRTDTITFTSAGKEPIEVSVSQPPVGGGDDEDSEYDSEGSDGSEEPTVYELTLTPSSSSPQTGYHGSGTISVGGTTGLAWTASSSSTHLRLSNSSESGTVPGTISYEYDTNPGTSSVTWSITVSAQGADPVDFDLELPGSSTLSLSDTEDEAPSASAGTGSVGVTSDTTWVATGGNLITVTSPLNGQGSGNQTISYSYLANQSLAEDESYIFVETTDHTASATFTLTHPAGEASIAGLTGSASASSASLVDTVVSPSTGTSFDIYSFGTLSVTLDTTGVDDWRQASGDTIITRPGATVEGSISVFGGFAALDPSDYEDVDDAMGSGVDTFSQFVSVGANTTGSANIGSLYVYVPSTETNLSVTVSMSASAGTQTVSLGSTSL